MERRLVAVIFIALFIAGCAGPAGTPFDGGAGGTASAGGGAGGSAGGSSATGGGLGGGAQCTPLTCQTAGLNCGTGNDGCGGTLNCGACACTPSTFATDCPSKPCQVATGCTDNTCLYEPVTCAFERCDACTGQDGGACGDTDRRACGAGCPADFCDPSPSMSEGRLSFANRCVARADVRCGVCDLGGLACVADAGVACQGVTLTGINPQFIECNGGSPSATVLFVDPTFTGSSHTGAKDAPFLTLSEALSAAAVRSSRAIIVGGSPTFAGPLVLSNGVSILGGFTGYPTWVRDLSRRPTVATSTASLTSGQLVGLIARDIITATELSNFDVETAAFVSTAPGDGASNIGAQVTNASALTLRGVKLKVGNAQGGAGGTPAAAASGSVPVSQVGQNARSNNQGCSQSFNLQPAQGGVAQSPTCSSGLPASGGLGGDGATVVKVPNSGVSYFTQGGAAPTGAQGGLADFRSNTFFPGPGGDGAPWSMAATFGSSASPSVTWLSDLPVAQGRGGVGTSGSPGRGGGGGSGGFTSESLTNPSVCRVGAGGGAGGAGGCGGNAGGGGFPGGWAIGLAVSSSSGLTLDDVAMSVGLAGSGGSGGPGSAGLSGAVGGSGGTQSLNLPAFAGSPGGNGAAGQRGGDGGAGASGLTRGVLCRSMTAITSTHLTATGAAPSGFLVTDGCN
ncbi:MAG: hypothetical protein IPJ65_29050 [Archangiaceae bacterium]|nr:hypothetical protein [Archangiaceae bacterium]